MDAVRAKWHSRRKLLTPAFHFKILQEFIPIFNKNSNILVEKLSEYVNKDYIPINKLVSLCTLDIICGSVRMFHRVLSPWLWRTFALFLSPTGWKQRKLLRTLHGFTDKVIKERRAEYKEAVKKHGSFPDQLNNTNRRRLTFLDLLIEVSEREGTLSNEEIREEGHDTTSAGISWALYLLGRNQHVQVRREQEVISKMDRVVEELQGIFGDSKRPATFSDLQAMKYLEQAIKESLRLYPSVPFYGRYLEDDIIIKNYTIPVGTNVLLVPIYSHRNPMIYPDPEVFNPDRFSTENSQERHPFAYLPFSAGPRNCIGQRFALLEEKAVLSSVLRNFRIESLDKPEDIAVMGELILRPKHELRSRGAATGHPTTTTAAAAATGAKAKTHGVYSYTLNKKQSIGTCNNLAPEHSSYFTLPGILSEHVVLMRLLASRFQSKQHVRDSRLHSQLWAYTVEWGSISEGKKGKSCGTPVRMQATKLRLFNNRSYTRRLTTITEETERYHRIPFTSPLITQK
uniref:Cytochrome P450 n=1 Tax=Timema tahoe TaxID=61484 RepID=A0A7R9NZN3_9NEOP|nr:unnamed protein product [Timema tahoe]